MSLVCVTGIRQACPGPNAPDSGTICVPLRVHFGRFSPSALGLAPHARPPGARPQPSLSVLQRPRTSAAAGRSAPASFVPKGRLLTSSFAASSFWSTHSGGVSPTRPLWHRLAAQLYKMRSIPLSRPRPQCGRPSLSSLDQTFLPDEPTAVHRVAVRHRDWHHHHGEAQAARPEPVR